jgi:hypothetical protein
MLTSQGVCILATNFMLLAQLGIAIKKEFHTRGLSLPVFTLSLLFREGKT